MNVDIDNIFQYHAPDAEQQRKYLALRCAARDFAHTIRINTPEGADQTAAIRKVREAVMTANAAVALRGTL